MKELARDTSLHPRGNCLVLLGVVVYPYDIIVVSIFLFIVLQEWRLSGGRFESEARGWLHILYFLASLRAPDFSLSSTALASHRSAPGQERQVLAIPLSLALLTLWPRRPLSASSGFVAARIGRCFAPCA